MDNLETVWRKVGYPPGKRILSKHGEGISERPYKDRWGSLRNACELLAQYKKKGLLPVEWVKMRGKSLRTHDLREFLAYSSI